MFRVLLAAAYQLSGCNSDKQQLDSLAPRPMLTTLTHCKRCPDAQSHEYYFMQKHMSFKVQFKLQLLLK